MNKTKKYLIEAFKHIGAWSMAMCMLFFAAAPVARTNLHKWMIVGIIAAVFSEIMIAAARHPIEEDHASQHVHN